VVGQVRAVGRGSVEIDSIAGFVCELRCGRTRHVTSHSNPRRPAKPWACGRRRCRRERAARPRSIRAGRDTGARGRVPKSRSSSSSEHVICLRKSSARGVPTSSTGGPDPSTTPVSPEPPRCGRSGLDVTLRGPGAFLIAGGGAGSDTIVPAPGAPFPNDGVVSSGGRGDDRLSAPRNSWGSLGGGAGDDVQTGGWQGDNLLGGNGGDRLRDAGAADLIAAGQGRGRIFGGPGRDRINSRRLQTRHGALRRRPGSRQGGPTRSVARLRSDPPPLVPTRVSSCPPPVVWTLPSSTQGWGPATIRGKPLPVAVRRGAEWPRWPRGAPPEVAVRPLLGH
jgi:hypothetical protein